MSAGGESLDDRAAAACDTALAANTRIGPGHLVLVVGPSGAGKDTLIAHVRDVTRDDDRIVFPRRVITREADGAEDHDTLSDTAFERAIADGVFTVWWDAHGHKYAIPSSAEDAIKAGRTVVCNVSRGVVAWLRQRFSRVSVVLVTAPPEVLARRLAARGRVSDGDLEKRVTRGESMRAEAKADIVVTNVAAPETAAGQLLAIVRP
jgi:ribose 1,5-bisphosphokinase